MLLFETVRIQGNTFYNQEKPTSCVDLGPGLPEFLLLLLAVGIVSFEILLFLLVIMFMSEH